MNQTLFTVGRETPVRNIWQNCGKACAELAVVALQGFAADAEQRCRADSATIALRPAKAAVSPREVKASLRGPLSD
jgi:hypothetical protein